jgi:5-dehydro-2-deoxygluconokinase
VPESRPLVFELDELDEIKTWPSDHTVKCLITYHPDDKPELQVLQESQIQRLSQVVEQSQHDWLLEIITPVESKTDDNTFARILNRFYDLSCKPTWWKIPAQTAQAWQAIDWIITKRDPTCAGVLIMGHSAPIEELAEDFQVAAAIPCVKGYMVGRSVFAAAARAWFEGRLDDSQCVQQISKNYEELVHVWQQATLS